MTNTLLLHNFTYFYVTKEDAKVYILVNPPTGVDGVLYAAFPFGPFNNAVVEWF